MIDTKRRLRLLLEADGLPGLLPLLEGAAGALLGGRFRLDGLLAIGRQSYLYAATAVRTTQPAVVKQPAFDYRQPLRYNRATAARVRQPLLTESRVLQACTTGHLPRLIEHLTVPSPVPAANASPVLSEAETVLVEEHIAGTTLTLVALQQWSRMPSPLREDRTRQAAIEFLAFWDALRAAGWHYGDINADNFLIEADGRLRVVDAGSAVPAKDTIQLTSYTPAYMTPRLMDQVTRNRHLPGGAAAMLPRLAKVLHFCLTRREPFNGALPDLTAPDLGCYSAECRRALAALLHLDAHPEATPAARTALAEWSVVQL